MEVDGYIVDVVIFIIFISIFCKEGKIDEVFV